MATSEAGAKRSKLAEESSKEESGTVSSPAAPIAQWTTTAKVSFGETPSWLSSPGTASTNKDVPSWLKQQPTAGSNASFGAQSSFSGGLAAGFGGAASFGGEATFGSVATFGAASSFGTIASAEPAFGGSAKKKKETDIKEEDVSSDNDDDNNEEGEDENNAVAEFGAGSTNDDASLPPPSEVSTGEENEKHVYQTRAKLFKLSKGEKATWNEMGVGNIRLNVPLPSIPPSSDKEAEKEQPEDHTENSSDSKPPTIKVPRLIMRRQGVLKLILNAPIHSKVAFEKVGDNMLRFACESFTDDNPKGDLASFLLKFSRADERNTMFLTILSVKPEDEEETSTTKEEEKSKADDKKASS